VSIAHSAVLKKATFTLGFVFVCLLLIVAGALQCFAPKTLKDIQDKLQSTDDYSRNVHAAFFDRIEEEQSRQPSLLYRLSGFMVMSLGAFMLVLGVLLIWR
jgi:uncharacterized protein YjeT (DUF2065 family)